MSRLSLSVLVVAGMAWGDGRVQPPPTDVVMKELRRIESATYTGGADEVRITYTAQVKANAGDPMPRIYLAWLTLPSDDAWNQLKSVAVIFPDNPWVHYGMGRIYAKWKMRDQALAELSPLLKRDPNFYPATVVLGDLALAKDDLAAAERHYRQALQVADDPAAHAGLGLVFLKQDKRAEAAEQLKRATKAWPEQPVALAALVPLLAEAKDPALLEAAAAVVAMRPRDLDARKRLAELRFDAGDKAGATKDYEQLVKLGVNEPAILERLLFLYEGNVAGEERVLRALASAEPDKAAPLLKLAKLKQASGDVDAGVASLEEAVEREPKSAEAHFLLAKLRAEQGVLHLALEHFRAAAAQDPSNEEAAREVTRLEGEFKLPRKRLKGNVNGVYWAVGSSLDKLYTERKAARRASQGSLKLKLRLNASGAVEGIDVLEDTLKDPVLLGHAWFGLHDAEYWDKKKLEAVIEFALGKKKK